MSRFDKTTNINIEDIDLEKLRAEVEADRKARQHKKNIFLKENDEVSNASKPEEIVEKEPQIENVKKTKEDPLDKYMDELLAGTDKIEDTAEDLYAPIQEKAEELESESLKDIVKNDFQEKTIVEMNIPSKTKIGMASDHRGYKLKQKLTKYLTKKGYDVIDYGCDGTLSCDYPEFGFKLGEAIKQNEVQKGIAICGSGIGISIACNKIKGVRCAKVDNVKEVKYTRRDNDANVIAIAGNMPVFRAKDIVDVYLKTEFSLKERHQKRIDMLNERD